jgi:tRNA threonylcarbamoyladenosine modification (KEOPS) complex  Pcc1 subunit
MSERFRAELAVPFQDEKTAKNAHDSLVQETEFTKKSRTKLVLSGSELKVSITADDFASLRATVNSYARLLAVFYAAKEVVEI